MLLVTTSLLMWMPVCGPIPEFRISVMGSMIYLFLQSVVPTIPAAWLTFAEDVVYKSYDTPVRLWGISAVEDQQTRRARSMKVGGGMFLWTIVVFLFFKRFAARHADGYDYRRGAHDARRRDRRPRRAAAHDRRRRARVRQLDPRTPGADT